MTTTPLITPQATATFTSARPTRRWSVRSLAVLTLAWSVLQIGGLFTPGLLDDVDSVYIEVAREMLHRHDYVTPMVDGIRFFDKPPLMYWMAAGSMHIFGVHDWAARLPLALSVLALLFAVYGLGIRLFSEVSPADDPDRGGFYAALGVATCIGPYLYTRFYIPDILLALWMTLGVHLFLIALDRVKLGLEFDAISPFAEGAYDRAPGRVARSARMPCIAFAAVMALNVLTKGLIGLVFPLGFVLGYLAITGQLSLLRHFCPAVSSGVFLVMAVPWHILAAIRNPPIALPPGLGLPAHGGWAWFYLYNEHFARFLGKRIPHDYGLTPVWLFWVYLAVWLIPWTVFVPSALAGHLLVLRAGRDRVEDVCREHESSLALVLWTVLVVGFFSVSSRQEYYSLPAVPALALMAGGLLARADSYVPGARRAVRRWHLGFLVPMTTLIAGVCAYFAIAAPRPAQGTDIASLLASNPRFYNVSLGHLFDLTGAAMGLFRGPLVAVALSMMGIGLGSYLVRRKGYAVAANLTMAAAMVVTLMAAHSGLERFYPALGSKQLALDIGQVRKPGDLILLDGELTMGSTLLFYTGQQVHVVDGRVNGLWYGSFWPDTPHIFEDEASLRRLWAGPHRVFLMTYHPEQRKRDLVVDAPVYTLAASGGKTVLSNRAR